LRQGVRSRIRGVRSFPSPHHSNDNRPSGAVIYLPVFGQPVAARRRTRLEGVLAMVGEIRDGGLFGMLSLVAQFVYWSRIVSGLNQEHA
jgi:hypothetical protein